MDRPAEKKLYHVMIINKQIHIYSYRPLLIFTIGSPSAFTSDKLDKFYGVSRSVCPVGYTEERSQ